MRVSVLSAAILLGLALPIWPLYGQAESDRDFVFTDLDGHLVVRFAGAGAAGLDPSHIDEISNAEFSRMIHDRLRADLLFQDEPHDPEWAASMEPQIAEYVKRAGLEFSDLFVECRAASCRVVLEQHSRWSVPEHLPVLATVQESLETFIMARSHDFERVFMITAYYKESQTPHIKAFLRRSVSARLTHQSQDPNAK